VLYSVGTTTTIFPILPPSSQSSISAVVLYKDYFIDTFLEKKLGENIFPGIVQKKFLAWKIGL
jgi:hypothetical protein